MKRKSDDQPVKSGIQIVFTPHALLKMKQRHITEEEVISIVHAPSETIPEREERVTLQGKRSLAGGDYLFRVVAERRGEVFTIITVYRTSKLEKYSGQGRKK